MVKNNTNIFNINDKSKKEISISKQTEQRAKEKPKEKTQDKQNIKETPKDNNQNNQSEEKKHKSNKNIEGDRVKKSLDNDISKTPNKEKVDLNNIESVNTFAKNAYKKYFAMDLTKDKNFKFDIEEKTVEKTSEKLWFCSWMGNYEGTEMYLNILISKEDGCIKKIDKYDYSNEEQDQTIMDDQAKKIALDFVNKVHKEKINLIGETQIIKNSKDGYKIILPKKNGESSANKGIMIVAVNPYSGVVNSFTDLWN